MNKKPVAFKIVSEFNMQNRPFPLHPAQQDVYTDQLINVESSHYNVGGYITLKGSLNKAKFHETINSGARVFDAFKMRFDLEAADYVCYLDGDFHKCELEEQDFSNDDHSAEKALVWMQNRFNTPFAIRKDVLLFDQVLIKIADEEHWYFCRCHHLITDGYGYTVWVQYMARKYQSLLADDNLQFSYPPYQEEAIKSAAYKNAADYELDGNYWKGKFTQKPLRLLQKRYPEFDSSGKSSATYILNISNSQRKFLEELQLITKSGLQQLTIAALTIYFAKTTGQSELLFGIPLHKRNSKKLRNIIGMFSGILPYKGSFQKDVKLSDLLKEISATQRGDYRHQNYLIGDLAKHLKISSYDGYLCEVIINYEPLNFELSFGEDIEATIYRLANEFDLNPLQLSWRDYASEQPLQLHIHFRNEYFSQNEIELLAQRVMFILEQFSGKMDQDVESIRILPGTEHALLVGFNGTKVDYPKDKTIVALFEEQVLKTPEATAIVFEQQKLTYKELNERSNQLAHYLRSKGVKEETLVPICTERSPDLIVGILGILKAGGAYVPINPDYPEDRISFMLQDISAAIIIGTKKSRLKLQKKLSLHFIELDAQLSDIQHHPITNLPTRVTVNNLAYIIYTSGSTGRPKGVLVEHGNVVSLIKGVNYVSLTKEDVLLSTGSPSFDATTFEYWGMLLNGGQLILCREEQLLNSELLKEQIAAGKVTTMWFTSSWFNQLTDTDIAIFEGLKTILVGGEKLSEQHIKKVRNQYPLLEIINGYGPTENTTFSLTYKIADIKADTSIPIGRPLSNRLVYILDEEQQLVPMGVSGEICLSGAGLSRGYLNQAALTAEKFVADPFSVEEGARMYRTGDLGRWLPDGNVEYLGRKDEQVKIRGFRIELGEIESVLQQSGLVSQAVVMAREDGEGTKRLVGYVVADHFDREALVTYVRSVLPDYMVPALWVKLDRLPLTANGKVDKKALPDADAGELISNEYVAPRNQTEEQIAQIWKELLHVDNVGIHDNFFELGGDSIITIQIISRAKKYGYALQPKDIFVHQTVANVCVAMAARSNGATNDEQGLLTGRTGLLPIQQWYFEKEQPDVSYFNQSVFLEINKSVTGDIVKQAFIQLTAHHDALRFQYNKIGNEWHQQFGSGSAAVITAEFGINDLSISQLHELTEKYQRGLNIEKGELIRIVFIQTPDAEINNRLLIIIHHLAVDGVSWRILLDDLQLLLGENRDAKEVLGSKSSSYRQWYNTLENYGKSNRLLAQKAYWEKRITNYNPLPVDNEYSDAVKVTDTGHHLIRFGAEETRKLLQEVPRLYHTEINDILLSALAVTLCNWCGRDEVVIGLEGHGREHIADGIDTTHTVGWFTSLYPVLLKAGANTEADSLIKEIKEQLRQVPDKGIGYGVLKYINKEQIFQGAEYWDIVFNYLGQLDNVSGGNKWFTVSEDGGLAGRSEEQLVREKLAVNSHISKGELAVNWSFSKKHYREETIVKIAADFLHQLQLLISHCLTQAPSGSIYTPSDYGLGAEVTYKELDVFLGGSYDGKPRKESVESIYPLSGLQQGILFHGLYEGHSEAYKVQFKCDITGLEWETFNTSWKHLLQQHSALRTGFYYDVFSVPVQCVYRHVQLPVEMLDYRHLNKQEQDLAIKAYEEADLIKDFDFKRPPLMRVALLQVSDQEYRMLWTSHHILFDGWSLPLLVEEFLNTYDSLLSGKNLQPAEEDKYEDYIRYIELGNKDTEKEYWVNYLSNIEHSTLLPFIKSTAERTKGAGSYNTLSLAIDAAATGKIQSYVQNHRLTVSTLMQGVWSWLLHCYTGNSDIVFGVVVSGRPADLPRVEHRVGLFINTLPLYSHISEEVQLTEWLQGMQQEQLSSRQFQHTALSDIQQWTGIKGDIFDSLLVFENYPVSDVILSKQWGLRMKNVSVHDPTNYPLTILINGTEQLDIRFNYNNTLLNEDQVRTIRGHFEHVLEQIVENGIERLSDIQLLTAPEKLLLHSFNDTTAAYPKDKTVVNLFEEQVLKTPESVAVVFDQEELTYRELNERANRLAHYLRSRGVKEETLVPICIDRSMDMITGILGILKAGGAYVPIDPSYPAERIRYMLEDTGSGLVISSRQSRLQLPDDYGSEVIVLDTKREAIENQPSDNLKVSIKPANLAYVIYTSGSTGKPKGVMNQHNGIVNRLIWGQRSYGLTNEDAVLQKTTFSFDVSVWELLWPLVAGARLVFAKPEGHKDNEYLKYVINHHKITAVHFVPSMLSVFLNDVQPGECRGLMKVFCSGEALISSQAELFRKKLPEVELHNLYGPTEAAIEVTYWSLPKGAAIKVVPIGKPVANTQIYIIDRFGRLAPIGVAGEIGIGGVQVARGYLNQPALTAEKFVANPFSTEEGGRMYRTGDLGRWLPDGNVAYLGRKDEQVKIRGYRIELGEIESVLQQSGLVSGAVVVAREDEEGTKRLIGYVVADHFDREAIATYLKSTLPDYMVPALWVKLDSLPLTSSGKVNKKALPDAAAGELNRNEYVAPRNQTEEKLAQIWKELLHVDNVGIYDNFFELGGHSLLAMRLISAIRKELTIDIGVKDLFLYPAIGVLAEYITNQGEASLIPLIQVQQRPERIPLSFSQERLWFVDQLEGSVLYHSSSVLRLKGNLNRAALSHALETIVARHEILRTVLVEENGTVYQHIKEKGGWQLSDADGSIYLSDNKGLKSYIQSSINRPFDLSKDDLLRAELIALNANEHLLVFTMHHIASDAWSVSIIVKEVAELYQSYCEGHPAVLPQLELQYGDYAIWQRNYLKGAVLEEKVDYWRNKLEGVAPLELPLDHSRTAASGKGSSAIFSIDGELSSQLHELSRQEGSTLFMTLLAAFKVLLYRYSGQEDICVGTSIANRPQRELEGLIGFFVNTLALRSEVSGDISFRELLQRVRTTTLEAYDHQDVPFEKVVEAAVKERDALYSPLFQVMLVLHNTPEVSQLQLGEVTLQTEDFESTASKFDITFFINESGGVLHGFVQYRSDLYSEERMSRMMAHFKELLVAVVNTPDEQVGQLGLLGQPEREELLSFSKSRVGFPANKTVSDLFEEQALRYPDVIAVVGGVDRLTYNELNERAGRLAIYLQQLGVKEDTLVPLFIERSVEMLVGMLGILKAGGAYVAIDTDFPLDRISFMLADTKAAVVVSSKESRQKLYSVESSGATIVETDDYALELVDTSAGIRRMLQPSHLAYVIYTSGSTGNPKGVMIEHRSLVDYVYGLDQKTNIADCKSYALVSSIATDLGNTVIYSSLLFGGTLHVFSKETVSNAAYLGDYFEDHPIDCLKIVPSHWKALSSDRMLLPVKLLVFGGEALQPGVVASIYAADPGCRVVNHYGPTETTIGKLLHLTDAHRSYTGTVPIGRPFSNTQVYILNKFLQLCPVGIPGQLYIAGEGVARGYLNNAGLTKEKFITNPFSDEDGALMYSTGDLVKYDGDGNIEFLGRVDDQVKIRGFRVEPSETERVLSLSEQVKQAVVVARDDKQGNKRLVGYLITQDDFDREELNSYLKGRLPDYMIPSVLMEVDSFPLTANGKVDRKKLPDPESVALPTDQYVAAASAIEVKLTEIWKEILEVDLVGIHDDFFELGGHSLLAVRLISAIRKEFSAEMPISDIFDYPTVSLLSGRLPAAMVDATDATPRLEAVRPRPARLPLSFSQERLWFIDRLEGSIHYHVPAVLRLKGRLNKEALSKSLQGVVSRHEVLRTVILNEEGMPYQYVRGEENWVLNMVDGLKYKDDDDHLQEYIDGLLNKPFDLSGDYMLRAHLICFEEADNMLVLTLHHIASDGWSRSVLVKELVELYRSYEEVRTANLDALPVQYTDYAIWQRQYLRGEVLEEKLGYWKRKLEGVSALVLPTDYVRPAVWRTHGALSRFLIDKALSQKIHGLGRQHGTTLYMTLLAAFKVLLYRYSGQEDISVGSGIAGRQQHELEGLIGFFVNTLVMRSRIDGEASFLTLLQDLKITTLEAYEHQEVPFEKVVDAVAKERDMSRNPLFQVSFVVQNTPDVPEFRLGDTVLSINSYEHVTSKFDITFSVTEIEDGLKGVIEYSTNLYAEPTIHRMAEHFTELLRSVVNTPEEKVSRLHMLTLSEEQELINTFSKVTEYDPEPKSIVDLFEQQVLKTPDDTAVIFEQEQLSFKGLNREADQLAAILIGKGVKAEVLVPICIERGLKMIIGILGILKAGGAYVPIDPQYPKDRISYILDDTHADLVVSSRESRMKLPDVPKLEIIELDGENYDTGYALAATLLYKVKADQLAYIIYTSGSTGKPKGVMIEHGSVVNLIHAQTAYFNITNDERILQFSNYCFDASVEQIFLALFNGATLVLFPEGLQYNTILFEDFLRREKVSHVHATPFFLENINPDDYESLRRVIAGGDVCRKELAQKWKTKAEFYNEYGPTETTVTAIEYHDNSKGDQNSVVPIGKPLANVPVYIVDKNEALCPTGIPGELLIGGIQVARGYLNRPELTQEKFISNKFVENPGARLYRTGDLARWLPDGNLEFLGRIDEQVKVRGYRIELGEIESVLNELEPVENSCVVAKKDGGATNLLVAYYIPNPAVVSKKEHELYNQQILSWQEIHENEYVLAEDEKATDPEFNILGWNDSFTKKAIPEDQMREWLKDITDVIFRQNPGHVLEIGCGTGMIYYQLAGRVKKYIGTDFSRHSINQISERISSGERNYGPTELQVCAAHEISLEEEEQVDTIILNSVVQYFPGGDYLNTVIEKSIALLKGKGCIIIGDIRDNRLQQLFRGRLNTQKLQGSASIKDYKWAVAQEVLKEEELCFSPEYFYGLQLVYPEITNVHIQWKKGSFLNELTLYRYTVIIHVGEKKTVLQPDWQNWNGLQDIEGINTQLEMSRELIALKGVPNPRLWKERLLDQALQNPSSGSVNDLVHALENEDKETIGINQLLHTAESKGYQYRFLPNDNPLTVNVLIESEPSNVFIANTYDSKNTGGLTTNVPLFNDISFLLQKELRLLLLEHLPEYMVPAEIVALPNLPVTLNGKVDRLFLSQREDKVAANELSFEPPRNALEQKLADIWQELLHLEHAGIYDNFFELGGHSLMGMRVISAIRRELNMEVGIKDLFMYPTIAELSGHLFSLRKGLLLPPIVKQPRPDRIPLSFSQERLWFIDQLSGSVQYHLPAVIRLKGSVNVYGLKCTLQEILHRHEVLRTVIRQEDGQGYQYLLSGQDWQMEVADGLQFGESIDELRLYIQQLIDKPFDLSQDYMLRAHLLTISPEEHLLVVTMHHIAADAWSMPIIIKEVAELYGAFIESRPARLETLQVQYADYSIWQRTYLQGEVLDSKIRYWKEKLTGVAPLQLPVDYARPAVWSSRGSVIRFNLGKKLSTALKLLSHKQESTLFMTLLAAFNVLLHRYSNQEDICVGTSVANRNQKEVEELIGFFVNMLALRTRVSDELSFIELLEQVKSTTLEAYECQEVPFEKVVDAVVTERDMSKNPLIQVMLILLNTPKAPDLQLQELILSLEESEQTKTLFDISFYISEAESDLQGWVVYANDLYNEHTITQMIGNFQELLTHIVANPEKEIGDLQLLTQKETHQLLVEFNKSGVIHPIENTIISLFEEQVLKTPQSVAVSFGQKQLTYDELNKQANQLAHYLRSKNVREETLVPVCLDRSLEMIIGILGILKAGGAYVPIDYQYPEDRIRFMLDDTAAAVILCSTSSKEKLPLNEYLELIELDGHKPGFSSMPKWNLNQVVQPDNLAYVIYTSGSTGKPKGVMVEHKNVVSLVSEIDYVPLNKEDVLLSTGSPSFDATTFEYWSMLLNGGHLVLCSEEQLLDTGLLKKEIEDKGVNKMWFTSSWFNQLVDTDISVFDSLDTILVGGEKLSEQHIGKMRETHPSIKIINGYGPTENTSFSLTYTITETDISRPIPIGRPMSNRSAYILDGKGGLVPVGVTGEICVAGAGLSRGYLNNEELTKQKFVFNPLSKEFGGRLYKTGDLGRWLPNGNIEYLGRFDDQVKIRGYRIELGEIQSVLAQTNEVRQCAVFASEDQQGRKRLVAYVVPENVFDKESMVSYLKERLPEYMVPALWVELESMPLTANGKIDKRALPDPDMNEAAGSEYEEPRTKLEEELVQIWQDLLDIDKVGIQDNFFELGGDSILAIQMVSRARQTGHEVKVADVFTYQTIAGLSEILEHGSSKASGVDGEQALLSGTSGLLPIQQWYFEKDRPGISHFNQSVLFGMDKTVAADDLNRAVAILTAHHDALRFKYYKKEGQWYQEYGTKVGEIVTEDLRSNVGSLSSLITALSEKHQRGLDIEKGELVRVVLVQTPQNEQYNRLLIIIHHLAVDGVSWRILLEDLELLLGKGKNDPAALGKKSTSYRQWYDTLEKYSQSRPLMAQKEYWERLVNHYSPLLTDSSYRDLVRVKDMGLYVTQLGAEETRNLLQEVPRVYHTEINDILLSALATTLCTWSSRDKVVIGLEGHGREHIADGIDTTRTVGWFTSLYPILLEAGRGKSPDSIIKGVKEQLRQVPDKGVGYGVLKYINKEHQLQGVEHWDVVFNYLGQLDNVVSEGKWLKTATESAGSGRSEEQPVEEKLSVNSYIRAGELTLNWSYSNKHYGEETVKKIAAEYIYNLKLLIAYCMEQGKKGVVNTPSDYGLGTDVTIEELDEFLEEENSDNILSF